ncbi:hypothetical protein LCGC14_2846360 [marine sediment metagenome]|uniref:Uncharacterized protein n=1 Tax=marine sediment metagenome TaxID=412755 RepID=A0A0F8YWD8_9ZZZZ
MNDEFDKIHAHFRWLLFGMGIIIGLALASLVLILTNIIA